MEKNKYRNVLLDEPSLPYGIWPMDNISKIEYVAALEDGLRKEREEIAAIAGNEDAPTFENTIAAYDCSGTQLLKAILTLSNLTSALGTPELQDLMEEYAPKLSELSTEILLNEKLWSRIRSVHDNVEQMSALNPEQRRLVNETYRNFAENGANLTGEDREEFQRLRGELSSLSVKFSKNVTEEMRNPAKRMWVRKDEVTGLPDTVIASARNVAKETLESEGKADNEEILLFTMYAPSYIPFMKYADQRELREKLYRLYSSRNMEGEFDNREILKTIVSRRLELARLMGKKNFAEFHLQGTMASTPENVMAFLESLRESYLEPMREELKEIEDFAKKTEGSDFRLMPWDYSYWVNRLKEEKFSFKEEEFKPYFELNRTIDGVFGLATKLYGYTFSEVSGMSPYHKDVKVYEVKNRYGEILGILYADFFYREGKSPGAWMTEFRSATKDNEGHRELPLISIVMNFSKPNGSKPVLLTPSEVETFLHEFGHALHGLSSQSTYATFSGTNVYHDFVELFSQFNENYLTQKDFLDGFASKVETDEKIPDSLLKSFVASHRFGAAYACMRQLGFGYLDMAWHTLESELPDELDVWEFERKAQEKVRCFEMIEGCAISPSFGHIFSGGYAAGYYGYKWSEVLDADAFSKFLENGIFDPATADSFRKMLEAGGTEDPMVLYERFRGRRPSVEALMSRDGITKK